MRLALRTLQPGQFSIFTLLGWTALAAVVLGVIRLPAPWPEKSISLLMLFQCIQVWRKRGYLHPMQGDIPFVNRRRIAILDFISSTLIWPFAYTWFYFARNYRSNHPIWFSDIVFCASLLILFAIATWKLTRALRRDSLWINTINY